MKRKASPGSSDHQPNTEKGPTPKCKNQTFPSQKLSQMNLTLNLRSTTPKGPSPSLETQTGTHPIPEQTESPRDPNYDPYPSTSPLPTPSMQNHSIKAQELKLRNPKNTIDLTEPINSTGFHNNPTIYVLDTYFKTLNMGVDPLPPPPKMVDCHINPLFNTNPQKVRQNKAKNGTQHQP